MVSAAAFSLKGGGWYAEGYGTKAETASKSETDTAAGAETTTTEKAPKEAVVTDSAPKETVTPTAATSVPAFSKSESKNTPAD